VKYEIPLPYAAMKSAEHHSKFIEMILQYSEHIDTVYLPLGHLDANGRASFGIRSANANGVLDIGKAETFIKELFKATEGKIKYKILMNDLYPKAVLENWGLTYKKVKYYQEMAEIESIVVADISVIDKSLGMTDTDFPKFCLSTNATTSLKSLSSFLIYDVGNKINGVVFNRDDNRSPELLQQFIDSHRMLLRNRKKILMLNEGCALYCPYKQAGDIEIQYDNNMPTATNIHSQGCAMIANHNPWLFLTSPFLTNEMLAHPTFSQFVGKIAGRNLEPYMIENILRYYLYNEHLPISNLGNIHQLKYINTKELGQEFSDLVLTCAKDCAMCRKCEKYFKGILEKQAVPAK